MEAGQPSRTALGAAMHRAAHQLEDGAIFRDPFALPIIGAEARHRLGEWAAAPQRRTMRWFIAARHRFTDDKLAQAAAEGLRQTVIVGAGLDTTAVRGVAGAPDMRYFEVDHPDTQAWKRRRLAEEGIAPPAGLTFVPVDFESSSLGAGLERSGFDCLAPSFFIWLGVVPYLTEPAILATLGFVATVPGAHLVFDYANPPSQLDAAHAERHLERAQQVARAGEPWISYFDSADLRGRLTALGAADIEDLGPAEIQRSIFGLPEPTYAGAGGHVVWVRWPK